MRYLSGSAVLLLLAALVLSLEAQEFSGPSHLLARRWADTVEESSESETVTVATSDATTAKPATPKPAAKSDKPHIVIVKGPLKSLINGKALDKALAKTPKPAAKLPAAAASAKALADKSNPSNYKKLCESLPEPIKGFCLLIPSVVASNVDHELKAKGVKHKEEVHVAVTEKKLAAPAGAKKVDKKKPVAAAVKKTVKTAEKKVVAPKTTPKPATTTPKPATTTPKPTKAVATKTETAETETVTEASGEGAEEAVAKASEGSRSAAAAAAADGGEEDDGGAAAAAAAASRRRRRRRQVEVEVTVKGENGTKVSSGAEPTLKPLTLTSKKPQFVPLPLFLPPTAAAKKVATTSAPAKPSAAPAAAKTTAAPAKTAAAKTTPKPAKKVSPSVVSITDKWTSVVKKSKSTTAKPEVAELKTTKKASPVESALGAAVKKQREDNKAAKKLAEAKPISTAVTPNKSASDITKAVEASGTSTKAPTASGVSAKSKA